MGKVKSALEKAMERISEIEELTPEEKEELRDREKLKTLLAAFYKGELDKDQLWQKSKEIKQSLLKEAQHTMADAIRMGSTPEEFQQRRDGILAIEALKDRQNTSAIETLLHSLKKLQKEYSETKERAIEEIKRTIEGNPQMMVRPVRMPDGRTVLQQTASVDEAVQSKLSEFLSEHEKRYEGAFSGGIEKLKGELR
jgi:hypothetical protein